MKPEELILLDRKEVQEIIENHLDSDPGKFALQFRQPGLPSALIATQLELLQKAKTKLPDWYAARCIFNKRAFEQSSSQTALQAKAFTPGSRAVDMTGGLGVDTWHLSQSFRQVDHVDPNQAVSQMAEINFRRLSRGNIKLHCMTAEAFLEGLGEEEVFDLIYLDPDRRNAAGRRVAAFEDCQPNVLALLPKLYRKLRPGGQILIKASPMLDIAEGQRQLLALVPSAKGAVTSIDNEVKELLFRIDKGGTASEDSNEIVTCNVIRKGILSVSRLSPRSPTERKSANNSLASGKSHLEEGLESTSSLSDRQQKPVYLYEADVAFYKTRLVTEFFDAQEDLTGAMNHPQGYFLSEAIHDQVIAKVFQVLDQWPFKPKKLKQILRQREIKQLEIIRRNFDLPVKTVYDKLGLKPGGQQYLVMSKSPSGERIAYLCNRIR